MHNIACPPPWRYQDGYCGSYPLCWWSKNRWKKNHPLSILFFRTTTMCNDVLRLSLYNFCCSNNFIAVYETVPYNDILPTGCVRCISVGLCFTVTVKHSSLLWLTSTRGPSILGSLPVATLVSVSPGKWWWIKGRDPGKGFKFFIQGWLLPRLLAVCPQTQ